MEESLYLMTYTLFLTFLGHLHQNTEV